MQEVYKTLFCDVAVIGGGTGGPPRDAHDSL